MNSVSRETREIQVVMSCNSGLYVVGTAGRISHPRKSITDAVTSISGSAGAFTCSGKHINEFCNSLNACLTLSPYVCFWRSVSHSSILQDSQ